MLIVFVLAFSLQPSVFGQTNLTKLDEIIKDVGGITNVAIEPYATYAPHAQTKWGGGMFLVYNVNPQDLVNVGLGLGLDWLGSWSMVNANVSLQLPFHPAPAQFPSWQVTPIILAGVGTPYTGGGNFNGDPCVVSDAGFATKFGHVGGGQFNAGVVWGKWNGSGPNDVARYHVMLGWSHGF